MTEIFTENEAEKPYQGGMWTAYHVHQAGCSVQLLLEVNIKTNWKSLTCGGSRQMNTYSQTLLQTVSILSCYKDHLYNNMSCTVCTVFILPAHCPYFLKSTCQSSDKKYSLNPHQHLQVNFSRKKMTINPPTMVSASVNDIVQQSSWSQVSKNWFILIL